MATSSQTGKKKKNQQYQQQWEIMGGALNTCLFIYLFTQLSNRDGCLWQPQPKHP